MRLLTLAVVAVTFTLVFGSCRDKIIADKCNLSYGRETFYIQFDTVRPNLDPNVRGVFAADPDGLFIDPNRGFIIPSRSASGQRYLVKFVSLDNREICETTVLISGINYPIGIYNRSTPGDLILRPFYDASLRSEIPTGPRTVFQSGIDERQNVRLPAPSVINPANGNIDLKAVNIAQLFGATQPTNGTEVEIIINYALNDESNATPNQIRLAFVYYRREADIPEAVRERLRRQQEQLRAGRVNGEKDHVPPEIIISDI